MRSSVVSLVACTFLWAVAQAGDAESSPPVANEAQPDATIALTGGSVAAGIGYTWGKGDLSYRDSSRPFSIKGISVVDVGATGFTAKSEVHRSACRQVEPE